MYTLPNYTRSLPLSGATETTAIETTIMLLTRDIPGRTSNRQGCTRKLHAKLGMYIRASACCHNDEITGRIERVMRRLL